MKVVLNPLFGLAAKTASSSNSQLSLMNRIRKGCLVAKSNESKIDETAAQVVSRFLQILKVRIPGCSFIMNILWKTLL